MTMSLTIYMKLIILIYRFVLSQIRLILQQIDLNYNGIKNSARMIWAKKGYLMS